MFNLIKQATHLLVKNVGAGRILTHRVAAANAFSNDVGKEVNPDINLNELSTWNVNERKVEPAIPEYTDKKDETKEVLFARLQYQSRKRGTLENGLLLSSFCSRHLPSFSTDQLFMYDRLINKPSNEWDIYYWVTGAKPIPAEFDNEVMTLLKRFAENSNREMRITMPDLVDE